MTRVYFLNTDKRRNLLTDNGLGYKEEKYGWLSIDVEDFAEASKLGEDLDPESQFIVGLREYNMEIKEVAK